MAQLKINNQIVDLGSAKIVLSKSAYSATSWLAKQITFSERVRLPQTPDLNALFLRPKSPAISGDKYSQLYPFEYSDNGKIVFQGVAKLLGVNASNQFELQLLDSSYQLFKNMADNLQAMELDSEDFVFNSSAYSAKKTINSSVWLWSASNQHEKRTLANNVLSGNLAFSRPFFSVQRLLEKMLLASGWTYENSVNSELINKLLLSSNHTGFNFCSYEKTLTGNFVSPFSFDFTGYSFLKTDTITGLYQLNVGYDTAIRIRGYITASADCTIKLTGISSTTVDTQEEEFAINEGRFYYDFTSAEFVTDDPLYYINIDFEGTSSLDFEEILFYTQIPEEAFGDVSLANFTNFKVKTYDNIPAVKQIDVFKHSLVSVGGFFTSDNLRKIVKINSLNEISKLGANDWSDKLNEDTISSAHISDLAKINYFAYDNSDILTENVGRGTFLITDETLEETKDVYKSYASAINEVVITDLQVDLPIYSNIERVNDLNLSIAYYENIGAYSVARFADLNGKVLLNNYYKNLTDSLQDVTIITAKFALNKSDFFLFDFTKSVYLDQLNSTFFVLGIKNYSEGNQTELTLLKIK